jgi:hypothetical protein
MGYRPAWKESEARDYILDQAGKQFGSQVVAAFMRILDDDSLDGGNWQPFVSCAVPVGDNVYNELPGPCQPCGMIRYNR